ncbi:MAG: quinol:cytochrome C oxidoreductase, partial [Bacteroidetes bacterium]
MYTFSNRLKIGSLILMALGLLGMGIGFVSAPSTVEEAKAMVASHDDGHGGGHEAAAHQADAHDADHDEHLLHQLQNRPWAAMYVAVFFFFMIALGVLGFYGVQRASQAGWSPLLFRVMEGITAWLVPGGIILFVILVLSVLHMNHLFVWMDADTVAHDELLQGKAGYLNRTFFLIRALIFLGGWIGYREISRRLSLAQDAADDNSNFKKNFRWSAGFLVFYLVSESIMSWDWIMSLDPHWFSTLFGWYVFASMFVSGI